MVRVTNIKRMIDEEEDYEINILEDIKRQIMSRSKSLMYEHRLNCSIKKGLIKIE